MNSILKISKALFAQLEENDISHCHWKSNQHLLEALIGHTDIDLLVDRVRAREVESILLQLGFKRVHSQSWCQYPGMEDWIGFDADSGQLVHVHLHYLLLMGRQFVKELQMPIENNVLKSAVKSSKYGVYIADPNLEIILLLIRVAHKVSSISLFSGLLGKNILPDNILREFNYLRREISDETVQGYADELLDKKAAADVVKVIMENRIATALSLYRIKRSIKRALQDFYRMSPLKTSLVYWHRKSSRLFSRVIHRFYSQTKRKKTLENGGCIIAFIGCDGSGKSTVAGEIIQWLSWKNDVEYFYMGSGDGKVGFFTLLKQRLNKYVKKKKTQHKVLIKSIKEKSRLRSTLNHLILTTFNFALAKERQRKVLCAFRCKTNGKIVVTDRYPQNEFKTIYDGPQIRDRQDAVINLKFLRKLENRIYSRLAAMPPDLVIKLKVPLEVSRARKPDENLEMVKRKIDITDSLTFNGTNIISIDAARPLEEVLRSVKTAVWNSL